MMLIVTDDKPKNGSPPRPPAGFPDDSFAAWKPVWTGARGGKTPHDLQERHSPSENVSLRAHGARRVTQARRRIVDARLWDSMSPGQQDAAVQIALAYETLGRGLGFVASRLDHMPGAVHGNVTEAHAQIINTYIAWTKECHREKVSHSMIIDILCFGVTLAKQDRDRRQRKGRARENLMAGLDVFCRIKGWPV